MIKYLQHYRIRLAVHQLKTGAGGPLLLLHGLGERSPEALPSEYQGWQGPVYALDFTGHGLSTVPVGGGYTCEVLLADADCVLNELGRATVVGRGLGAYIAFLLLGARPAYVDGVVLCNGPGLLGGGVEQEPCLPAVDKTAAAVPDPFALADLSADIRLPEYVASFARRIGKYSPGEPRVYVCTAQRPAWLATIEQNLEVVQCSLENAISACHVSAYTRLQQ